MTTIATIVEGDGEVAALPVLLRRLASRDSPQLTVHVPPPIRVRRDRFLRREEEFRRQILLANAKCGSDGWILVLLDADDDCPASLALELLQRSHAVAPHARVSVVLANREYEAWFVAAAGSLNGHRGFTFDGVNESDPDKPRNAKGWIERRMASRAYREIIDQPAFTAVMNLELAGTRSRSFRKLLAEWQRRMAGP